MHQNKAVKFLASVILLLSCAFTTIHVHHGHDVDHSKNHCLICSGSQSDQFYSDAVLSHLEPQIAQVDVLSGWTYVSVDKESLVLPNSRGPPTH